MKQTKDITHIHTYARYSPHLFRAPCPSVRPPAADLSLSPTPTRAAAYAPVSQLSIPWAIMMKKTKARMPTRTTSAEYCHQ